MSWVHVGWKVISSCLKHERLHVIPESRRRPFPANAIRTWIKKDNFYTALFGIILYKTCRPARSWRTHNLPSPSLSLHHCATVILFHEDSCRFVIYTRKRRVIKGAAENKQLRNNPRFFLTCFFDRRRHFQTAKRLLFFGGGDEVTCLRIASHL